MKEIAEEVPDTKTGVLVGHRILDRDHNQKQEEKKTASQRTINDSATALIRRPMLQRKGDGNSELNQQERRDPEES